jgi:REP element-mobilizing transposase RayT
MPHPGKMWRHVIISTRRSWLHGDKRGFRSRGHRIHSSGDYKAPPPDGEHAGLLAYHEKRAKARRVKIPRRLRCEVGAVLLHAMLDLGHRVLAMSVSAKHAHGLVELPRLRREAKAIVGRCKCARSARLRKAMPGSIWGEGGKYKPVKTRRQQVRTFGYITDEQGPAAWTWSFRQPLPPDPRRPGRKAKAAVKVSGSNAPPAKPRAQRRER